MLNWVFLLLVVLAVLVGGWGGLMPKLTEQSVASAKGAVDLAIGLIGQMAVWLGFMRILQDAGLTKGLARALAPVMRRLFPEVPADHPAMGAMVMNFSANMLGLGNAATPFGLKAMVELNKLNSRPGVATDAMALFLAINTSGLAILPLGVVGIRATLGSKDPAGIVIPTILATAVSTATAIVVTLFLRKLPMFSFEKAPVDGAAAASGGPSSESLKQAEAVVGVEAKPTRWSLGIGFALLLALPALLVRQALSMTGGGFEIARNLLSDWMLPTLMFVIVVVGFMRGVRVYESFIAGAKESFQIAMNIIPFLVAILLAIGLFRTSGAFEAVVSLLAPVTAFVGMPAEALPMALIRPLSGSGAMAVMSETMRQAATGPDTLVGWTVSIMNGATETTFYVLAVYFGAVGVRSLRHTLPACLSSEVAGMLAACWFARLFHH